jgi:hypothetical protein
MNLTSIFSQIKDGLDISPMAYDINDLANGR